MTREVQKLIQFNPGDVIHIERGILAGWSVHRGYKDRGVSSETAFFSEAKDVIEYLSNSFRITN